MSERRPFALLRDTDQWIRCSFDDTALDVVNGVVSLAWPRSRTPRPAPIIGAGLAFDAECRLYHSVPDEGRVDRIRWAALGIAPAPTDQSQPLIGGGAVAPQSLGDFSGAPDRTLLGAPRGLAIDEDDRL